MKKFHYKKGDSLDKTPIILRLDRCDAVNANQNGVKKETSLYSSRATSISSLDQLKDMPTPARNRSREATKSLSEDIFSCYSTPSTVVITETELSSSWLYKNMKAVTNCEQENRTPKSQIPSNARTPQQSLSPVVLQDPKLKPVPVRKRSRCCHMTIIVAICICTLGFLSTIGTVMYLEKFSHISHTIIPTGEPRILRVVHTPKSDPTELDNEVKEHPRSLRDSDTVMVDDIQRKTIRFVHFGAEDSKGLTRFIDRTEIRLEDLSRYGEEARNSTEYNETAGEARHSIEFLDKDVDDSRGKFGNSMKQMENNFTEVPAKGLNPNDAEMDVALMKQTSDFVYEENGSKTNFMEYDSFSRSGQTNYWSEVEVDAAMKIPGETAHMAQLKVPSDENIPVLDTELAASEELTELDSRGNTIAKYNDEMLGKGAESNKPLETEITLLTDASNFRGENEPSIQIVNGAIQEESFRNRSGDRHPGFEDPDTFPVTGAKQRPALPEDRASKKPVDMKVSLAEAMERFKVLDDKFPSLRAKSGAPKNGGRKQKITNKDAQVREQMQYLSKLRLYLYDRVQ